MNERMTRSTLTIAAIAFLCSAAAATPQSPVTFESPCPCHDNHGEHRWAVKNDPSTPPADASAIQAVTPSDMFGWPGPDVHLTGQSQRTGIENKWFAVHAALLHKPENESAQKQFPLIYQAAIRT